MSRLYASPGSANVFSCVYSKKSPRSYGADCGSLSHLFPENVAGSRNHQLAHAFLHTPHEFLSCSSSSTLKHRLQCPTPISFFCVAACARFFRRCPVCKKSRGLPRGCCTLSDCEVIFERLVVASPCNTYSYG